MDGLTVKQKRWSSFAGSSVSSLSNHIESILESRNIDFKKNELNVPTLQSFFLGGEGKGVNYHICNDENEFKIELIPAFADPVTKVVFSITSSEKKVHRMKQVCVVQIYYTENSRSFVSEILRDVNTKATQPLWVIRHHPRFQTGIILANRVKRAWQKWI